MGLFWTTEANFGREAAAFSLDNWELMPRSGRLLQLGKQLTSINGYYWAFRNNYGRVAAAFLLDNWKLRSRSGRFLELGNWHQ